MFPLLPDLRSRRVRSEAMDDPGLHESDLLPALRGLRRINRVSSPFRRQWRAIREYSRRRREPSAREPLRLLDVATGSGDFPRDIARRATRAGFPISVTAIDRNPAALREAERLTDPSLPVRFECADVLDPRLRWPAADVVTVNLFLHHLEDDAAVAFLRRLAAVAPFGIVSELQRGRAAWMTAWAGGRMLSRSWVVGRDAPDSVRAGFRRRELHSMAEEAGLGDPLVRSCFPFRWLLTFRGGA